MFRRLKFLPGACLMVMVMLLSAHSFASAQDLTAGAEQPDHTFWQNIKDTTLPDLFAMFIERYPNSTHRPQAEQRLKRLQAGNQPSSLEQARQLTGSNVQTGARVRGITPKTATRSPVLGAPVLATAPMVAPTLVPVPAPAATQIATKKAPAPLISLGANGQYFTDESSPETILLIQYNLKRVGCMIEKLDGKWGPNSQAAAAHFATTIDQPLVTITPNTDLLRVLKSHPEATCPPVARPAPLFKRPVIRKIRRTVKSHRIIRKQRAAPKRRTTRPRGRASRKAKKRRATRSRGRARATRARRASTARRKTGRSSRKRPTVSASRGRSNGGGGQRRTKKRASSSNFGGGQSFRPGRGGSNRGGGQRSRSPGRGTSNGGGGQSYVYKPPKKGKIIARPRRPVIRRPSIKSSLPSTVRRTSPRRIQRGGGFGGRKGGFGRNRR